jgi:hypothetical protein
MPRRLRLSLSNGFTDSILRAPKLKWDSIRKAIQRAWTKDEIDTSTKKLAKFKDAVETHILFSIV